MSIQHENIAQERHWLADDMVLSPENPIVR